MWNIIGVGLSFVIAVVEGLGFVTEIFVGFIGSLESTAGTVTSIISIHGVIPISSPPFYQTRHYCWLNSS